MICIYSLIMSSIPLLFLFFLIPSVTSVLIPSVTINLSRHSKEGISLQCCILEKGSRVHCMSRIGLGLDSVFKAES